MSDIKLFTLAGNTLTQLTSSSSPLEKALQTLFESNLETLLGVRFLASEFSTTNGGRMDTIGIDENNYPVIIEYKRVSSENVINQGLFYLDWLMDHKGDFELLVRDRYGKDVADEIEWSAPRLICIAADFNKFDSHAVKQMSRNIDLISYQRFGDELLLLDQLTTVSTKASTATSFSNVKSSKYKTNSQSLADADENLANLYSDIETYMISLGDDITQKTLDKYFAFKRIKNFACVEIKTQLNVIRIYLKVDPTSIELEEGFSRDVRNVGHYGTGDLEVTIKTHQDLERVKPLIEKSYEVS
ncbi:hypothetical protein MXMO3_00029 [Maritalea myrionectae]|uniref:DUF5655 domain-containing protein n=1 Tax=Maritalea myrionectae TaxID=454601 RepID=A0A2R4M968_9HYPH|nr:DUF5655 domain-containing protein [Maritalea myrionectae]AVX02577.1 hypothetical protein MXMO3_00029 [Maritalea myrionectae]